MSVCCRRTTSAIAKLQKDEIRSAIERVAQFADERSRAIRVQFTNGEVKMFSSSVETGESEESVPSEYQGPDLEIGFNAQYLLDFLRAIPQDQVAFELKDQKSAGELRPGRRGHARISTGTSSCRCGSEASDVSVTRQEYASETICRS